MNCRDAQPLIDAERDGVLSASQHAELAQHLDQCPDCAAQRAALAAAMTAFRTEAESVAVPSAAAEWREVRNRMSGARRGRRPLAPLIWLGAPLAAAAAIALVFANRDAGAPTNLASPQVAMAETARAEYVELGDAKASPMVYVDKESGWLVVWAVDAGSTNSG